MIHKDKQVNDAIIKLSDALCTYERTTGIESVLIIREPGGFVYRALGGKPNIPVNVSDENILKMVTC